MRNSAYPICITTLVLAAFGVFFRWLQNQVSFDLDTGLAVRGSLWTYAMAAWLVIAAVILLVQSRRAINRDRVRRPETFSQAFRPIGGFTGVIVLLCGLLMAIGGVILFLTVPLSDKYRLFLRVIAVAAVVYGVLFPVQLQDRGERTRSFTVLLSAVPILLFSFWIIVSYKENIVNPSVTAYAVEILTLAAFIIGFYQVAGFAFDRPKPIKAVFWALYAAFFGLVSIADKHYLGVHVILVAAALMLMLQAWLIASNVRSIDEFETE